MNSTVSPCSSVAANLSLILESLRKTTVGKGTTTRLVAVSKTKPASDILAAYQETGHRDFGENYVQELVEKAKSLPTDINWHYIGALQSNKLKQLAAIPNLAFIETLASVKHADILDKERVNSQNSLPPIKVFIQINTSNEDSKNGIVEISEAVALAKHIREKCLALSFSGLMTIGSPHDDSPRPDFQRLIDARKIVADALQIDPSTLELSMGMSNDYEIAAEMGSTNIRVGSKIFGNRL